ncbi:MAG: ABC transporter permease [Lachnospiraceae bacterium]|nr:ABC transporter permease [Lachnospiraceae bacterium]
MKHLYCRLAVTNLKNNRQFYLPYILVGIVSAMMFYCMRAIKGNDGVKMMRGAGTVGIVLNMGVVIVGICAGVFLFYTNSFVMKRRKKELGVYNILGMEKKHIAKVMAWEAVILYVDSVGGGLVFGIVFNKLLTMFLYKLTGLSEKIPFYVSGWSCLQTVELFAVIYVLMLLYNFIQVKLTNPIELLHSGNVGEREPKAKWISALFGVACIVAGYCLAIFTQDIIKAVNIFFLAVILVIAGTYELFMTVSIAFLKLQKRNKKYYYKTSHFITVSGMLYRMKRNAVGLANICVLSTMVLVMVSTTVCLYAGIEDALDRTFKKEITLSVYFKSVPDTEAKNYIVEQLKTVAEKQNRKLTDVSEYVDVVFLTHNEENRVAIYDNDDPAYNFKEMSMLYAMTVTDYEKYTGQELGEIQYGSVIVAATNEFRWDSIDIFGQTYHVAGLTDCPDAEMDITDFLGDANVLYAIVADDSELNRIRGEVDGRYHIAAEVDGTAAERKAYVSALQEALDACREESGFTVSLLDSKTEQREEYLEMNGGFLFLGLFLGSMFLMITVLIIYYKQISEGYEDRERFAIMTKVGMGRDEVKAAINAQVRTVFFMPITVAVIHLIASFPMLKLIMLIFGLSNTALFIQCLIGTVAVFAVIYLIVFKTTSRCYYKIVF